MSNDIALIWDQAVQRADIAIVKGDIAMDAGLQTAVIVSLLTDRSALPGDVVPDGGTPRGWWGDAYNGFKIGSRLWLLRRTTLTQATLNAAQDYAQEALNWMIEDGVAGAISVVATAAGINAMNLAVTIIQKGNARTYDVFWSSMAGQGA